MNVGFGNRGSVIESQLCLMTINKTLNYLKLLFLHLSVRQNSNHSTIVLSYIIAAAPAFLAPVTGSTKTIFPQTRLGGWFGDDSSTLHL